MSTVYSTLLLFFPPSSTLLTRSPLLLLTLRLPLLCVHAARPGSFDLRAVYVVEI